MTRQKSLINSDAGNGHLVPPMPKPADGAPEPHVSSTWGQQVQLPHCCSAIPSTWLPRMFQAAAQVPAVTPGFQPAERGDDVQPTSLSLMGVCHAASLAARLGEEVLLQDCPREGTPLRATAAVAPGV